MPTRIMSGAVLGLDGNLIEVETDISPGLPTVVMVGLPDTAVQEAKERVKSAIKNTGFAFPKSRLAINLAPADIPKSGSLYDLPIAISILGENGVLKIDPGLLAESFLVGELALDGRLRPVSGILPLVMAAVDRGLKHIFVPLENAAEAALVRDADVYPASDLAAVIAHLEGRKLIAKQKRLPAGQVSENTDDSVDFADIAGQESAKRALEIAAAGHHNVLFTGPPGSGKTMLAKALQGILPRLSDNEFLEIIKIYSIAGLLSGTVVSRPFRSPHHTGSRMALIGGGTIPKPGEVTLAHKGVLFLDEFPEFPRSVVESLRQPLEDGTVTVSRVSATLRFPAEFILVAAQNPCPCGHFGNPHGSCICSDGQIRRYQIRISGPILDRIDLVVEVPHQSFHDLKNTGGPGSDTIRERVESAKQRQLDRHSQGRPNARLRPAELKQFCQLDQQTELLLDSAVNKFSLSARAYHRVLKVARTIADLQSSENIAIEHVTEALGYRWRQEN